MDNQNQNPQQAIVEKIKDCKNILVTVSNNPSVDQLAACLGLTIWLNKIDKHATAVFSGDVPSTLEFLQPADTLEKNTDSLRDFIISLDKSKADKLRYKVEDSVVKVFVTPYRTSLTADDLEFSQGDFNVDMVIALGVHSQDELDAAITAHGRILHDATVATVTIGEAASELGSIGWHDTQASSLSELVVELANSVDREKIDSQIATALLTGIVAETQRFSNEKTTPQTMSVSAQLMSAGANQQLVATKLDEPAPQPEPPVEEAAPEPEESVTEPEPEAEVPPSPPSDGAFMIDHEDDPEPAPQPEAETDEAAPVAEEELTPEVEAPASEAQDEPQIPVAPPIEELTRHEEKVIEPIPGHMEPFQPPPPDWMPAQPWMAPAPSADSVQSAADTDFSGLPSNDDAELTPDVPVDQPAQEEIPAPEAEEPTIPEPVTPLAPEPIAPLLPEATPEPIQPQSSVEEVPEVPAPTMEELNRDLDSARDEVMRAIQSAPVEEAAPEPVQALNALPIDLNPAEEQPAPTNALVPAELPAAPPLQNTQFDPTAFGVMNDPEVATPVPFTPPQTAEPAQVDPDLTGPVNQPFTMPLPSSLTPPPANPTPPTSVVFDPTAPPPVPPPMPFGKQ